MQKGIGLRDGGELGKNNASKVIQISGELPSPTVVTHVDGTHGDDASDGFTTHLENRSRLISARVESIRAFVAANAEALNNAVAALRESDELSASEAAQMTALVDGVSSGKSLTGAAAGAAAGQGAASGSKQFFGA